VYAAENGLVDTVKALVLAKVDVNVQDKVCALYGVEV
jgi:hypothetical protein